MKTSIKKPAKTKVIINNKKESNKMKTATKKTAIVKTKENTKTETKKTAKIETKHKHSIEMYNNNPVFKIEVTPDYFYSFGLSKAKLILEKINEIKTFVNDYSK